MEWYVDWGRVSKTSLWNEIFSWLFLVIVVVFLANEFYVWYTRQYNYDSYLIGYSYSYCFHFKFYTKWKPFLWQTHLLQKHMLEALQSQGVVVLALGLVEEPVEAVIAALVIRGQAVPQRVDLVHVHGEAVRGTHVGEDCCQEGQAHLYLLLVQESTKDREAIFFCIYREIFILNMTCSILESIWLVASSNRYVMSA